MARRSRGSEQYLATLDVLLAELQVEVDRATASANHLHSAMRDVRKGNTDGSREDGTDRRNREDG